MRVRSRFSTWRRRLARAASSLAPAPAIAVSDCSPCCFSFRAPSYSILASSRVACASATYTSRSSTASSHSSSPGSTRWPRSTGRDTTLPEISAFTSTVRLLSVLPRSTR